MKRSRFWIARRLGAGVVLALLSAIRLEHFAIASVPLEEDEDASLTVISNVDGVSTSGGTAIVTGTGLSSTTQAQICLGCSAGTPGATWITPNPAVTFVSATEVTIAIPSLPAGNYDLILSDAGGFLVGSPQVLVISSVGTPVTCAATYAAGSLIGWYRPDAISSTVCTDKESTYGQNLTVQGNLTVTASDTNFNNQPSAGFDGGGDGGAYCCAASGWSLEGTKTLWVATVQHNALSTPGAAVAGYTASSQTTYFYNPTARPSVVGAGDTAVEAPVSYLDASIGWYGYNQGDGGAEQVGMLVGIGPSPTTNSGGNVTLGASGEFCIGTAAKNGTYQFTGSIADIVALNVIPSASYYACIYNYFNVRYALDPFPTIVGVTPANAATLAAGTEQIRVSGTGFSQGGSISVAGIGPLSGFAWHDANSVEATLPQGTYVPGFYDVTVTNADGEPVTMPGALNIEATANPWDILSQSSGGSVILWERADNIASPITPPVTGSAVSGITDLSRLYNDSSQPTSGDQPTWNSANSNVGNQPTVHFAGSQWLITSSLNLLTANTGNSFYVWVVYRQATTPSTTYVVVSFDGGTYGEMRTESTGKPDWFWGATQADWGSSVVGNTQAILGYAQTVNTTSQAIGINVNNGTPVTNSSSTPAVVSEYFSLGARTGGSVSATGLDIAEVVVTNYTPTNAQLTEMETYFHVTRGYY